MGTNEHMKHIGTKYALKHPGQIEEKIEATMKLLQLDRHNAIQFLLEVKMPIKRTDFAIQP